MALSQQDIFVKTILGDKGYYLDIGAGNGEREPCASNTYWLEEVGWTGILIEYDPQYVEQAKKLRPNSHFIHTDALKIDYKQLFKHFNSPKVIDYLSIDIEPSSMAALVRFPFDEYDFKVLTIEHDLYNMPYGAIQKRELSLYMKDKNYIKIVEDVGLQDSTTRYLEDWFINPKYLHEFKVPNIDKLYYYKQNPNAIVFDLIQRAARK